MTANFRAQLDALMGPDRDLAPSERKKRPVDIKDPKYCHYHFIGECPLLLAGKAKFALQSAVPPHFTRCGREHDDAARGYYNRLSNKEKEKHNFEEEYFLAGHRLVSLAEGSIDQRNQKELKERIERTKYELKKAEDSGAAVPAVKLEKCKTDLEELETGGVEGLTNVLARENVLLCKTCGQISVGDEAMHFEGQTHAGFEEMRALLTDLENKLKEKGKDITKRLSTVSLTDWEGSSTERTETREYGSLSGNNPRGGDRDRDSRAASSRDYGRDSDRRGGGDRYGGDRDRGYGDRDRDRGYGGGGGGYGGGYGRRY